MEWVDIYYYYLFPVKVERMPVIQRQTHSLDKPQAELLGHSSSESGQLEDLISFKIDTKRPRLGTDFSKCVK